MIGSNAANESDPGRRSLDPVLLDRLVDGELAEGERRNLLVSLDREPSRWRQCALAFLEAQTWRDLLGVSADNVAEETALAATNAPAVTADGASEAAPLVDPSTAVSARARRGLPRHWLWIAEMAASFLIAFSLGLWIRGGSLTTTIARPADPLATAARGTADRGETRTVEVVAQGAGGRIEKMQVPLVENRGWWQSQPAAVVPDEVRRAVERSGWQVRQERKYFPIELPDGRRALLPIDQIEMVPAGNRGMQ